MLYAFNGVTVAQLLLDSNYVDFLLLKKQKKVKGKDVQSRHDEGSTGM